MNIKTRLQLTVAGTALAVLLAGAPAPLTAQQALPPPVAIGAGDLGGTVAGPNGPEAGVWVIAETDDLPTRFAKIVVTDERGRYLIPDLPKANYSVWVRGYGLVDAPSRASSSTSPRCRRRTPRRRRSTIRRSTGIRCSSRRRRASSRSAR
jgi:hypothetical protein